MNWNEYLSSFDAILDGTHTSAPYDKEAYREYVGLNKSRVSRWLKKIEIQPELVSTSMTIDSPQHWLLITEPWCGDAAHSTPIVQLMAALNPNITLEIVLRDSTNDIESYLTYGGKSIPKLVVRNEKGDDLFTWGPRPASCQKLMSELKSLELPFEEINAKIQQWYNKDKGIEIQAELLLLFKTVN